MTAIVRDPEKMVRHPKLHPLKGEVYEQDDVARMVFNHDAVVSAFNPGWNNPDLYNLQIKGTRAIISGAKKAGVKRVIFVGGSGSLEVMPGVQSIDLPQFSKEYKQGALTGERTSQFRVGRDQLLRDANGGSRISLQDFAMAIIDEVERPMHIQHRITVGY